MSELPGARRDVHLWWSAGLDVDAAGEPRSRAAARRARAWAACGSVVRAYEPRGRVARVPGTAPTVTGVDLDLSFAYAGSTVAIAVSRHRSIGIDIEPIAARVDEALVRHALTTRELEALERLHPSGRRGLFLRAWVRKEAVLKAAAVGLLVEPSEVETGVGAQPAEPAVVPGHGSFRVVDLVVPGFVCAVAARGPAPLNTRWVVMPPPTQGAEPESTARPRQRSRLGSRRRAVVRSACSPLV